MISWIKSLDEACLTIRSVGDNTEVRDCECQLLNIFRQLVHKLCQQHIICMYAALKFCQGIIFYQSTLHARVRKTDSLLFATPPVHLLACYNNPTRYCVLYDFAPQEHWWLGDPPNWDVKIISLDGGPKELINYFNRSPGPPCQAFFQNIERERNLPASLMVLVMSAPLETRYSLYSIAMPFTQTVTQHPICLIEASLRRIGFSYLNIQKVLNHAGRCNIHS